MPGNFREGRLEGPRYRRLRALLLAAAALAACVRSVEVGTEEVVESWRTAALSSVTNLPAAFTVAGAVQVSADRCAQVLRDEGLGVTLTLVRSSLERVQAGTGDVVETRLYGDYRVDPGTSYGLATGYGLRVECLERRGVGGVPL